jgi:hypothetical protein
MADVLWADPAGGALVDPRPDARRSPPVPVPEAPIALRAATTTRSEGGPMYATIRIYAQAEGLADAVAANKDEILRLFGEIDGFRAYHIVRTGPTTATSITVCDDQAGVEATNQAARDYIAANFGHLAIGPPEVHVGGVAMSS